MQHPHGSATLASALVPPRLARVLALSWLMIGEFESSEGHIEQLEVRTPPRQRVRDSAL